MHKLYYGHITGLHTQHHRHTHTHAHTYTHTMRYILQLGITVYLYIVLVKLLCGEVIYRTMIKFLCLIV